MHGSHIIVVMSLALNPWRRQPMPMSFSNIHGHDRCRNYVVLEFRIVIGFRYTAENPEKVLPKILLGFHTNTARSIAGHKGFHLNMHESRSRDIATQDIGIGGIPHRDHSRISSTAKLAGDKELARISPSTFLFLGHDVLRAPLEVAS